MFSNTLVATSLYILTVHAMKHEDRKVSIGSFAGDADQALIASLRAKYSVTEAMGKLDSCTDSELEANIGAGSSYIPLKTCLTNARQALFDKFYTVSEGDDYCDYSNPEGQGEWPASDKYQEKKAEFFTEVDASGQITTGNLSLCMPFTDTMQTLLELKDDALNYISTDMDYTFCSAGKQYLEAVETQLESGFEHSYVTSLLEVGGKPGVFASVLSTIKSAIGITEEKVSPKNSLISKVNDPAKKKAWQDKMRAILTTATDQATLKSEAKARGYEDLDPECATLKAYVDDQNEKLTELQTKLQDTSNDRDCSQYQNIFANTSSAVSEAWDKVRAEMVETTTGNQATSIKTVLKLVKDADALTLNNMADDLRKQDCESENAQTRQYVAAMIDVYSQIIAQMDDHVDECKGPVGAVWKLPCGEGEPLAAYSHCQDNGEFAAERYQCVCEPTYQDMDAENEDYRKRGSMCSPRACDDLKVHSDYGPAAEITYETVAAHDEMGAVPHVYNTKATIICKPGFGDASNNINTVKCTAAPAGSGNIVQWMGDPSNAESFMKCRDIDECADRAAHCVENYPNYTSNGTAMTVTSCENSDGSYACTCAPGFYPNENGCMDINECPELCDPNANFNCENTDGSYECNGCIMGYNLIGEECVEITALVEENEKEVEMHLQNKYDQVKSAPRKN